MVIKRAIDIFLSIFLLILTAPLLILVAMAIKFTSKGPVIFKQERVGCNRKIFTCYKFRSMYDGASQEIHQQYIRDLIAGKLEEYKNRGLYKLVDDPRVTFIGRWIRRFSIDELPQLVNVLLGQMSLVGPRPVVPYEIQYYNQEMFQRFSLKPGMTGLWQVSGRSVLSYKQMVELDIFYIKRWSLLLDLKIMLKTAWVVLKTSFAC